MPSLLAANIASVRDGLASTNFNLSAPRFSESTLAFNSDVSIKIRCTSSIIPFSFYGNFIAWIAACGRLVFLGLP
jgi:hypothetical protein